MLCRHPLYHSFLRPSLPMASLGSLSQLVNATSSTSRVILKARSFILLPSNNPPFLSICAPTTSLFSPIMAYQHRASIFGSRSIISCRVLCFRHRSPRIFFTVCDQFALLYLQIPALYFALTFVDFLSNETVWYTSSYNLRDTNSFVFWSFGPIPLLPNTSVCFSILLG